MKRKRGGTHNLSHSVKQSGNMGYLMPICCFDVAPGDRIQHKITALIRTQPLLAPLMHEVDIDIHAYFSPDRLVWDESEQFHTGGDDGMDTTVPPYMTFPESGYAIGSLADYLGLPTGNTDNTLTHSALPFRHYNLIWNYYYRDSQLQSEIAFPRTSGADTTTPVALLAPCWKRDYFTKARPFPQLGPDVTIPLSGDAPITGLGKGNQTYPSGSTDVYETDGTGTTSYASAASMGDGTANVTWYGEQDPNNPGFPNIRADLSDVSAFDIRDLREASAVQRFLEFNNIFGGRYWEQMRARFGAKPQDYRLQMPEFLGAGAAKFQFSEVLATAETGTSVDVGDMKGHGISIVGSNRYKRKIPEHGWIMVFMIVRPKTQYMQGLHRSWSRTTKYDYLLPEFAAIGDQAIMNKEVYAAHTTPNAVFGYTPQYEEYRTIPSRVAGEFKDTLKYWHMAREFSSDPALNSTFVAANPTTRIYPAPSANQLYFNIKHDIQAYRVLPVTPSYKLM